MQEIAAETGWSLDNACEDVGIHATTYYRWVTGRTSPREAQAEAVIKHMMMYARSHA